MLSPAMAGQFAAMDLSGGGTVAGNLVVSGTLQTTNLGVGLAPDTTRIHMLSQASDTTPTAFTADDFVIGRSALTGVNSGALFGRYDSTNSKAFIGALSPGVAWRNLVVGAATTVFQNASGVAQFTTPGTGDADATLTSAGQYLWSSTTDATGTPDTGLKRSSAGVVAVTNGSSGSGSLTTSGLAVTAVSTSSVTFTGSNADARINISTGGAGNAGNAALVLSNDGNQTHTVGGDRTNNRLKVSAAGNPPLVDNSSSETNTAARGLVIQHRTDQNMVDGFGVEAAFVIQDSAAAENEIAKIVAVRDGADNTAYVGIWVNNAGTYTEKVRIDKNGDVTTARLTATATVAGEVGAKGIGSTTGAGLYGQGGATNGLGGYFNGGGTNGGGIYVDGRGTGDAVTAVARDGYGASIESDATTPIKAALHLGLQDTAPSSPAEGDIYADSVTHKLYYYNGTSWNALF